jgi:hypothetical protein
MEVGLEINAEKSKYMLVPWHQIAGQDHDIKIGNVILECVTVQISAWLGIGSGGELL